MNRLPKQTWIYNEKLNSFVSLLGEIEINKGDIIISYNPPMGFNCKPQIINRVWIDEYGQRCFTSVDLEEWNEGK